MTCVRRIHCILSAAKTDAISIRVTARVTIGVGRMRADKLSLNYPAKANFRIEIMKIWADMASDVWTSAGTFGRNEINQKN